MTTKPTRRTAAFDKAISTLQTSLAELAQKSRDQMRDLNADPQKLGLLRAEMQGLREKIEGQRELRAEVAQLDAKDDFLRARDAMRQQQAAMVAILRARESDAEELDALLEQVGHVLQRIQAKNREAWPMFVDLSRYITTGDARRARYDSLIYSNQSRISTSAAASDALVAALRQAGVGSVGISEHNALEQLHSYRVEHPRSVRQAMHEANDRVERHLAVAFKQTADEMLQEDEPTAAEETAPAMQNFNRSPTA